MVAGLRSWCLFGEGLGACECGLHAGVELADAVGDRLSVDPPRPSSVVGNTTAHTKSPSSTSRPAPAHSQQTRPVKILAQVRLTGQRDRRVGVHPRWTPAPGHVPRQGRAALRLVGQVPTQLEDLNWTVFQPPRAQVPRHHPLPAADGHQRRRRGRYAGDAPPGVPGGTRPDDGPPMTKDAVAGRIRSGLTRSRGHRAPVGFARMCLSCGVTQVLLVVIGLLLIGLPLLALVADRGQSPPRRRASQEPWLCDDTT